MNSKLNKMSFLNAKPITFSYIAFEILNCVFLFTLSNTLHKSYIE